jgi:hypothetical protein
MTKKSKTATVIQPSVTSIKGTDHAMKCRDFQFEIGKTYSVSGNIGACENGFHACPIDAHPLSVFEFYPPASSRYFEVVQNGEQDRKDTKLASASITIGVEISLSDLATRAVKWVFDRANWTTGSVATKDNEGTTASGYSGAATASGKDGKARGAIGNAIFLVHRDEDWKITKAWAGIVGDNGIKADTWYSLDTAGNPVEVT